MGQLEASAVANEDEMAILAEELEIWGCGAAVPDRKGQAGLLEYSRRYRHAQECAAAGEIDEALAAARLQCHALQRDRAELRARRAAPNHAQRPRLAHRLGWIRRAARGCAGTAARACVPPETPSRMRVPGGTER